MPEEKRSSEKLTFSLSGMWRLGHCRRNHHPHHRGRHQYLGGGGREQRGEGWQYGCTKARSQEMTLIMTLNVEGNN